jgi:hypothetical protein
MKWLSVEDCPPPQGGVYLAANSEDIGICSYWPHMKPRWAKLETEQIIHPTHWMQLPAPPNSEQEESPSDSPASPVQQLKAEIRSCLALIVRSESEDSYDLYLRAKKQLRELSAV